MFLQNLALTLLARSGYGTEHLSALRQNLGVLLSLASELL